MGRRVPEEARRCVEQLLSMGKTVKEVSEVCGVSKATVSRLKKELEQRRMLQEVMAGRLPQAQGAQQPKAPRTRGGSVYIDPRAVEDDVNYMLMVMRNRLDPSHPIMTKMITDTSWWLHVILDFGKLAIPELMGDDVHVDAGNPEVTAQELVRKVRRLKAEAQGVEERLAAMESEVKALKEENERLRGLVREYRRLVDEAIEKTSRLVEDLRGRVAQTLVFIVRVVPQALSPEERARYMHVVIPKLRSLWGADLGGG
ncbi:MAG: hypothetical protein DRO39_03525 [Thermoprotei archaeon]|nr:MAG: hypothetical protein DRO39_03525 [Thermoprotei archaeon]